MSKQKVEFADALAKVGTEREREFFANESAMSLCDPDDIAYKKLKIIIRHENTNHETGERWKANYHTKNQKWFPWPLVDADESRPSGFGLSHPLTDYVYAGTYVGSRLCSQDSATALKVLQDHPDLYMDFWLESN